MDERAPHASRLADLPAEVHVEGPELIGASFRRFERYAVAIEHGDGNPVVLSRDNLRTGRTGGLITIDLARDEIVLIRQFRLAAHLATGHGDIVEIPAGFVEPGEEPAAAAYRECIEEIGTAPRGLRHLFDFMPAPGILEECAAIYLASIDAAKVPVRAGASSETEHTRPIRVPIDEALDALAGGAIRNGYLMLALQWLALNRGRLADLLGES
jgi:ADP-ribose pyrophosphatase